MGYTRYGHVNKIFVKVGDMVNIGDKIATNGTGNGQWLAHLHRDHPKEIPKGNYGFYNIGWTKEQTQDAFNDPNGYQKALGDKYDHLGYGWLELANYGTKKAPKMCYHPGLDENGNGSGNVDLDDPVYAVSDGVVEYIYSGSDSNGGWGHLIVINETKMNKEFVKIVSELCGESYGESLNESEQKDAAKKLEAEKVKMQTVREASAILFDTVQERDAKIMSLTDSNKLYRANMELLEQRLAQAQELSSYGIMDVPLVDLLRELKNRIIRF